jgi:hypothetical protein
MELANHIGGGASTASHNQIRQKKGWLLAGSQFYASPLDQYGSSSAGDLRAGECREAQAAYSAVIDVS